MTTQGALHTANIDGYTITQAYNHHITISKDGKRIFHAQCNKEYSSVEELKQILDFALKMQNH